MPKHGLRLSTQMFRHCRNGHSGSTLVKISPDGLICHGVLEANDGVEQLFCCQQKQSEAGRSLGSLSVRNTPSTGLSFSSVHGKKIPYISATSDREPKSSPKAGQNLTNTTARPPLVEKNRNPDHKSKNPQLENASLLDNVTLGREHIGGQPWPGNQ
jgi:hypothetical protein